MPAVPQRGQAHPGIPNLVVDSVQVEPAPDSPTKAHVTVIYSSPVADNTPPSETATPTLEVGATVAAAERDFDALGVRMTLSNNNITQPFKASVQAGNPYITFGRREPKPFNKAKVTVFVGAVNSTPWFSDPPRTWLCTAIRARLNGDAFDVSYEFQYNRFTWDVSGIFIDPKTNEPLLTTDSNSLKTFRVYSEADFGQLSLGV